MRIMIIGYSGSGKSTLAATIAEREGIPALHLDCVHWLPGWQERERSEETEILAQFLRDNGSWVIDGNYSSVLYSERCEAADKIIFLDISRFACLRRAMKRYRDNRGVSRASMTEGCPEKMDREFLHWLLIGGRTKKRRRKFTDTVKSYPEKAVVIKSLRALEKFYESEGWK